MYVVEVLVGGKPVRKIRHNGQTYVPVNVGDVMQIEVYNDTYRKICASVSVDGIDVVHGELATYNDAGYVIDPRQKHIVNGWRISEDKVAQFVIGAKGVAYSEKVGKGGNQGAIGVVVHPEAEPKIVKRCGPCGQSVKMYNQIDTYTMSMNCCNVDGDYGCCEEKTSGGWSRKVLQNAQSAGTSYGKEIEDRAETVKFNRDTERRTVIVLYYDTPEALRARGVPVDLYSNMPDAFPGESKFCKRV